MNKKLVLTYLAFGLLSLVIYYWPWDSINIIAIMAIIFCLSMIYRSFRYYIILRNSNETLGKVLEIKGDDPNTEKEIELVVLLIECEPQEIIYIHTIDYGFRVGEIEIFLFKEKYFAKKTVIATTYQNFLFGLVCLFIFIYQLVN